MFTIRYNEPCRPTLKIGTEWEWVQVNIMGSASWFTNIKLVGFSGVLGFFVNSDDQQRGKL